MQRTNLIARCGVPRLVSAMLAPLPRRSSVSSTLRTPHVIELREYALHSGQREVLIELFDRELIEAHEPADDSERVG